MRGGSREIFSYRLCKNCHALELINQPDDLSAYYQNYYTGEKGYATISPFRKVFWKARSVINTYGGASLIRKHAYNSILDWVAKAKLGFNDSILDVGCGNGDILYEFSKHGFTKLTGLDPYPPQERAQFQWTFEEGNIFSMHDQQFDFIMFHHSLEHMDKHLEVLLHAKNLLTPSGKMLIRMPIVNKAFWEYKEHWVQIDAPRHLLIHSIQSFQLLCESVKLKIVDTFFDSTAFQFLGSEQNQADIAFFEPNSYKTNLEASIFTSDDVVKFEQKAQLYNQKGWGDQAGFIITPA